MSWWLATWLIGRLVVLLLLASVWHELRELSAARGFLSETGLLGCVCCLGSDAAVKQRHVAAPSLCGGTPGGWQFGIGPAGARWPSNPTLLPAGPGLPALGSTQSAWRRLLPAPQLPTHTALPAHTSATHLPLPRLVEGVLTHEMKRFIIDASKSVLNRPSPEAKASGRVGGWLAVWVVG